MDHAKGLRIAELIDSWRIFPRLALTFYLSLLGYILIALTYWYEHLPPQERTGQVTAVIGIIVPALTGLATWFFKIYSDGGRDWDGKDKCNEPSQPGPH